MEILPGIRYAPQILAAARANGLDPRLLAAIAAQETGGPESDSGSNIVGDKGHGHGVFQLDDRYHAIARTSSAMDPAANADYAGRLLAGLLRRFGGNLRSALSAYNAGSPNATGTVTTWPDGSRLGYADSVLKHLARIESRDGGGGGSTRTALVDVASAGAELPITFPVLQIPAFTPSNQSFRSYSSEYRDGGGSIADQVDRRMASLIDSDDDSGADVSSSTGASAA